MLEFYQNGSYANDEIKTKVNGVTLTYEPKKVGMLLGFVNKKDIGFDKVNTEKGLDFMDYKKKNPEINGYKKKDFPQGFKFLADIMGKCIIYKDSAHDSISEFQLQVMSAITLESKISS